jgi:AcrR family transcriptional regulator
MSSVAEISGARAPKRQRGRQRVAQLLAAAATVFAEKGYEAATMTEIALRAGAPIGSLYQFFPDKGVLADTLVHNYVELLSDELKALVSRAPHTPITTLVESLFDLLRGH